MRWLPLLLAALTFLVALVAGYLTWQTALAPRPVLRLTAGVAAGTPLRPDMVERVVVPAAGRPERALADIASIVGAFAAQDLVAGQWLSEPHISYRPPVARSPLRLLQARQSVSSGGGSFALPGVPLTSMPLVRLPGGGDAPADDRDGLPRPPRQDGTLPSLPAKTGTPGLIRPHHRVLSLPVSPARVLAGALRPGDTVDVAVAGWPDPDQPDADPRLLLSDVTVVDIRNAAAAPAAAADANPAPLSGQAVPAAVLLAVSPEAALTLIAAVEGGAAIYLLLSPGGGPGR